MLEILLIPTLAPPTLTHTLSWQNSTVENVYFVPEKASKEPIEFKPPVDNSLVILNRLRTFKEWTKNWDGEGAASPNLAAIETASNFLSLWSPRKKA
jgi:hypothetical protein